MYGTFEFFRRKNLQLENLQTFFLRKKMTVFLAIKWNLMPTGFASQNVFVSDRLG